jgi:hypothetical protein
MNFSGWQPEKKLGFIKVNQKQKSGACPEKFGWLLPFVFSSSCP